jgi:FkbM family methyltransferase
MTITQAIDIMRSGTREEKWRVCGNIVRKCFIGYPMNIAWIIRICWNYTRYVTYEKKSTEITYDVWVSQFKKRFGKTPPVHNTEFAARENLGLMAQFTRHNELDSFPLPGGYSLVLPPVANARDTAVNDLREILVEKIYEHNSVDLRQNDVVIDCGANIGLFSLMAFHRIGNQGRLIAIEPVPSIRAVLERNLSQADGQTFYHIFDRPVFSDSRAMTLSVDEDVFTMHHLDMGPSPASKGPGIKVQTTTIDELIKELGLTRVDFIKMDIEGAEMGALAGAASTLKQWKPRLAISAYHLIDDFYQIPRLIHKLNPSYHIYVSRGRSPMCYAW